MFTRIDRCAACFVLALGWLPVQALAADLPIRVTTGTDGIELMTNLPETIATQRAGAVESKPLAGLVSFRKTSKKIMIIPVAHEPAVHNETSDVHQNGKSFTGDD